MQAANNTHTRHQQIITGCEETIFSTSVIHHIHIVIVLVIARHILGKVRRITGREGFIVRINFTLLKTTVLAIISGIARSELMTRYV